MKRNILFSIAIVLLTVMMACNEQQPANTSQAVAIKVPDTATSIKMINVLMDSVHSKFSKYDTIGFPKLLTSGFLYYATFADEDNGFCDKDSIVNAMKEDVENGSKELFYKYHVHKRKITLSPDSISAGVFEHITLGKEAKNTDDDVQIVYHLKYVKDAWLLDMMIFDMF